MNRVYAFSLDAEVSDQQALYEAAFNQALKDGMTEEQAAEHLRPDGEISNSVCLQMLLDPSFLPGVEIIESNCERIA